MTDPIRTTDHIEIPHRGDCTPVSVTDAAWIFMQGGGTKALERIAALEGILIHNVKKALTHPVDTHTFVGGAGLASLQTPAPVAADKPLPRDGDCGGVRLLSEHQPASESHEWDADGERCVKCGDKDWMGGLCHPRKNADQPAGDDVAVICARLDTHGVTLAEARVLAATIGDLRARLGESADKYLAAAVKYDQRCNEVIDLRAKLAEAEEALRLQDEEARAARAKLKEVSDATLVECVPLEGGITNAFHVLRERVAELERHLAGERDCSEQRRSERDAIAKENGERLHHISELSAELANEQAFRHEDRQTLEIVKADLAAMTERAEKAEESQRLTQKAREDDRGRLQQKCSDWGTYWRASDAHGVKLNIAQATELLADALGVEVETDSARAEAEALLAERDEAKAKLRRVCEIMSTLGNTGLNDVLLEMHAYLFPDAKAVRESAAGVEVTK